MKTLRDAKVGETVKAVKLHGEGAVKRRIMDMGITRGMEVYVRKLAPLGDPFEVKGGKSSCGGNCASCGACSGCSACAACNARKNAQALH